MFGFVAGIAIGAVASPHLKPYVLKAWAAVRGWFRS